MTIIPIPNFFQDSLKKAKDGYKEDAIDLIRLSLQDLKGSDKIKPDIREYLISTLENTLAGEDANKGFYLSVGRGKNKKDTLVRDYQAARAMQRKKWGDIKNYNHQEALKAVADEINKEFKDNIDIKTVEAACTKFQQVIEIEDGEYEHMMASLSSN